MFEVGDKVVFNQDYFNYTTKGEKGVVKSVGTDHGTDTIIYVELPGRSKSVAVCAYRLDLLPWEINKTYKTRAGWPARYLGEAKSGDTTRPVFAVLPSDQNYEIVKIYLKDGKNPIGGDDQVYRRWDIITGDPTEEEREIASRLSKALGFISTTEYLKTGEILPHMSVGSIKNADEFMLILQEVTRKAK